MLPGDLGGIESSRRLVGPRIRPTTMEVSEGQGGGSAATVPGRDRRGLVLGKDLLRRRRQSGIRPIDPM